MSAPDSKKVVIAALAGNLAISICKFGAAFLSGSFACPEGLTDGRRLQPGSLRPRPKRPQVTWDGVRQ